MSLYDALRGSVFTKTGVTQEFTTTAEFYDRKTLCRADIESMFSRATAGKRFHESWTTIQRDLVAAEMTTPQIVRLQNSCIRYINARSAGETGATAFNIDSVNAILSNREEFDKCVSLPEMAIKLDEWLPSDYENRQGAFFVEAFEALK